MEFIEENFRIYSVNKAGKVIAEITFPEVEKGIFVIDHTFVDETLRGQGIASKLVEMAVDKIKKQNGKVTATCSYAKKWLEKNKAMIIEMNN